MNLCRMSGCICVFCPEPAAPCPPLLFYAPFSSPVSHLPTPTPAVSRPLLFLALLHTQRRKDLDSSWAASSGPCRSCPAFTMAAFSWLRLSSGFAPCSLPLPSSARAHTHSCLLPSIQLPLSPACPPSFLPPLLPAGVTEKHLYSPLEGGPPQAAGGLLCPSPSTQDPAFPTMKVGVGVEQPVPGPRLAQGILKRHTFATSAYYVFKLNFFKLHCNGYSLPPDLQISKQVKQWCGNPEI